MVELGQGVLKGLRINVFFTTFLIVLMCLISFALVGRSLMFDEYTTNPAALIVTSPQSGAYFSSQRAVIAFNFFYLISAQIVLYTTFKEARLPNIISLGAYLLAWIGRWGSSIAFLTSYPTLQNQLGTEVSQCAKGTFNPSGFNACSILVSCNRSYAWNTAYQEQIAAAVLFFIFGLSLIPSSFLVHSSIPHKTELQAVAQPEIPLAETRTSRYSNRGPVEEELVRQTVVKEVQY